MNELVMAATPYKCSGLFCGWHGYSPKYAETWTSTNTTRQPETLHVIPVPICPDCGSFCEVG